MSSPASDTFAAIDLGSNSFHMVVARNGPNGLVTIDRLRDPVRLAQGLQPHGSLHPDAWARGIAALSRFARRLEGLSPEHVRAVGTNALRMASDADDFIAEAEATLGFTVDVVSGDEEAALVYCGVRQFLAENHEPIMVFDIGGSSTELAAGKAGEPEWSVSEQLGCVTLSETHFPDRRVSLDLIHSATAGAIEHLQRVRAELMRRSPARVLGTSGALGTLATLCESLGTAHGRVSRRGLDEVAAQLAELGEFDRFVRLGISPDRAEVVAASLCIAQGLLDICELDEVEVVDAAIREGVLARLVAENQGR
ncbi:MAG: Ppx/GppA phosphatase family protein [Gammaproteobacteria bacterium]|nr:Ppx/GppA phosphatase family protein [Gammaproteobacteria bacterium]